MSRTWLNVYALKLLGGVSLASWIFNLIPLPPIDGYKLVTLGPNVPHRIQVIWAVTGWVLIAAGTFWWKG
jgi:Zn-dependent protease